MIRFSSLAPRFRRLATPVVIGFLSLPGASPPASARVVNCTIQPQPGTITFGQIRLSRDTPVGTAISEERVGAVSFNCPASVGPGGNGIGFRMLMLPVHGVSNAVRDVWNSGAPGIGVRVSRAQSGQVISNSASTHLTTLWGRRGRSETHQLRYQLVKTGPTSVNGQTGFGNLYRFRIESATTSTRDVGSAPYVAIGTGAFSASSCRITTPNIGVALPNAAPSALREAGAATGNTGFVIGLQCDSETNLYVTLTDATAAGNRSDLLTLTSDSTAQGVRLRIRNPDNEPVSFGPDSPAPGTTNQWLVGNTTGAANIQMSAEYVSTGNATAGTVRALATFTMSYQ